MDAYRATRVALSIAAVAAGTASCAGPTPHLRLPPLSLGDASFFTTLEAYTAAPIEAGNRVRVLLNGEEIFPAQLDAVRAARRTITYAQYNVEDGLVTWAFADAVAERCRAGIAARILLDGFGTRATPPEFAQRMTAAGCKVVVFRPLGPHTLYRANKRNHRRILVVDGRIGFTGGSGLGRTWMGDGRTPGHWRETDVRVEGPAVQHLQGAFAENWLEATGEVIGGDDYFPAPLPDGGPVHAQVVRSSPAGGGFAVYTTFLLALSAARRSIDITNPYFLPDDAILDALLDAARRGVRVRVLVPSAIDAKIVRLAGRRHFGRLLRAGVQVYEYRPGLLHAKTMVVDSVWATVGSTNFDNRSFALNDELNVVLYDRTLARRLDQVFAQDLRFSSRVEYRAWRERSFLTRLVELFARPLDDQL
jgi:cardiolipin synthase